jgi:hypothetical protein
VVSALTTQYIYIQGTAISNPKSKTEAPSGPLLNQTTLQTALGEHGYVAERGLGDRPFLSLKLPKPLFLEGEAGVGKTEIAKVLASILGTDLIRLQCYEGLDVSTAVYEWNYARQMMRIRWVEAHERQGDAGAAFEEADLFGPSS